MAGIPDPLLRRLRPKRDKAGIPMDEREFHCKGEFKGIHKGRPDAKDLAAAAEFAKAIIGDRGAENQ